MQSAHACAPGSNESAVNYFTPRSQKRELTSGSRRQFRMYLALAVDDGLQPRAAFEQWEGILYEPYDPTPSCERPRRFSPPVALPACYPSRQLSSTNHRHKMRRPVLVRNQLHLL